MKKRELRRQLDAAVRDKDNAWRQACGALISIIGGDVGPIDEPMPSYKFYDLADKVAERIKAAERGRDNAIVLSAKMHKQWEEAERAALVAKDKAK